MSNIWMVSPNQDPDPSMSVDTGRTRSEVLAYLEARAAELGRKLEAAYEEIKVIRTLVFGCAVVAIAGDEQKIKSVIRDAQDAHDCSFVDSQTPLHLID